MMRTALLATVAAVAGAHDAAEAVAAAPAAVGEVSWAEAKCMLRKVVQRLGLRARLLRDLA